MQRLLDDRRVLLPVLLTVVAIAVGATLVILLSGDAAGGSSGAPAASPASARGAVTIDIADYKFDPAAVTVKAGTKVTWVNHDSASHTATNTAAGAFDTGTLKKGDEKTLTLDKPGTYAYVCEFHPFMKATVIVR